MSRRSLLLAIRSLEASRHQIGLRRFRPRGLGLGMERGGEMALQERQQFMLGATLEHLGDEGAARRHSRQHRHYVRV